MSKFNKLVYLLPILILPLWVISFYSWQTRQSEAKNDEALSASMADSEITEEIPFSENASRGHFFFKNGARLYSIDFIEKDAYKFYLGKIDLLGGTQVPEKALNGVIDVLNSINFPKSIMENTLIIFADPLISSEKLFFKLQKSILTVSISKDELLARNGLYVKASESYSVIFLKNNISSELLTDTLIHELGHRVGDELTDEDWKDFYKLRMIPKDENRYSENWALSPNEDFAEAYRYVMQKSPPIKTQYGFLKPAGEEVICKSILDEIKRDNVKDYEKNLNLQQCRRYVMTHPDLYKSDAPIYIDANIEKLEEFFKKILSRFK